MVRGGLGGIMKQAQQMQRKMAQVQEELEKMQVEASGGVMLMPPKAAVEDDA